MRALLGIGAGALVWAAQFAVLYGGTALVCARGAAGAVPWIVVLSTLAGVAFAAAIVARAYPQRDDFAHWMAAAVAAAAAVAMLLEAIAGLVAKTCG